MIFVFAGLHGTGKSTIAKRIADAFQCKFYSTGMVFRDLAKEKKMSLEEFSRYSETHPSVDQELDNRILNMAKAGGDYVFDGQLPAYMLKSLSNMNVLLQCNDQARIQRMAERDGRDFETQKHETLVREESERQRFIRLYNIDVANPSLILTTYHLILDTTQLGIEAVYTICQAAIAARMSLIRKIF